MIRRSEGNPAGESVNPISETFDFLPERKKILRVYLFLSGALSILEQAATSSPPPPPGIFVKYDLKHDGNEVGQAALAAIKLWSRIPSPCGKSVLKHPPAHYTCACVCVLPLAARSCPMEILAAAVCVVPGYED